MIVLFDNPYWAGVFERTEGENLSVCKVTFGAEPKDYEVYEFVTRNYYHLQFSPSVPAAVKKSAGNPKRIQRNAKKQLHATGIGTRSQQALKLQQEQNRTERKVRSRLQKEAEAERKFVLKQQKRLVKHRGH